MELQLHDGDELFQIMKSKMTTEQEQMFLLSHYLYLEHGADSTAFVVDFDMVWKSVEFSRLDNAKRILVKKFTENVDYTIIACGKMSAGIDDTSAGARLCDETSVGKSSTHLGGASLCDETSVGKSSTHLGGATLCDETSVAKVHGGQNKEQILLTVDCFKQFCFIAATPKAKEIRNYYIKMKNIMHEYYKKFTHKNNELRIAKDAAKEILQHPSAMCSAIKHSSPLSNHYWVRLKHVDVSLQRAYLESNIIPQKQKNIRGTQIKLVNPTTNELIKTFSSYTEIQKELKISMRKIRECIETNSVCRGKYKFVKCSS
jgi:L-rhamnose mutarotase